MKCPYLTTIVFSLCRIGGRTYAPTAIEFHDFCKGGGHTRCPLFRKMGNTAGKAGK